MITCIHAPENLCLSLSLIKTHMHSQFLLTKTSCNNQFIHQIKQNEQSLKFTSLIPLCNQLTNHINVL